jgi:hypothetical protein
VGRNRASAVYWIRLYNRPILTRLLCAICVDCQSATAGRECDVIQSSVQIFYTSANQTEPTAQEQEEMLALLASTIETQAASGAFDTVGTVESVEVVNNGATGSSGNGGGGSGGGGGLGTQAIKGIPSGLGSLVIIAIAGFVIYKLLGRDNDKQVDTTSEQQQQQPQDRDAVQAHAIVVEDDQEKKDDGTWAKLKNQFL